MLCRSIPNDATISRAQDGDESAFAEIIDYYKGLAYFLALKRIGSEFLADDIVQEIFIKVWKEIRQYNTYKGSFSVWFYEIADNCSINFVKKHAYDHQYEVKSNVDINTYDELNGKIMESIIRQMRSYLSDLEYEIIFYRLRYEFNITQISRLINKNYFTVRRAYIIAKNKVEHIFEGKELIREKEYKE